MFAKSMALRFDGWKGAFAVPEVFPATHLSVLMAAALASSCAALTAIIAVTGIELHPEFLRILGLALLLALVSAYCDLRGHSWHLTDTSRLLAFATTGLLLCGLVSNTGLRLQMPIADPMLAAVDALLPVGSQEVVYFTAAETWIARVLHLAYSSSTLLCLAAAAWMIAIGAKLQLWRFVATAILSMQITAITSVFFPARGAILHFGMTGPQVDGLPDGAGTYAGETFAQFYSGSEKLVTLADLNGIVTFPSFHTVLALLIVQGFHSTLARWPAIIWSAATIVSTIPMGGHYFTDLAAGFVVWLVAFLIVERTSGRPEA